MAVSIVKVHNDQVNCPVLIGNSPAVPYGAGGWEDFKQGPITDAFLVGPRQVPTLPWTFEVPIFATRDQERFRLFLNTGTELGYFYRLSDAFGEQYQDTVFYFYMLANKVPTHKDFNIELEKDYQLDIDPHGSLTGFTISD